MLPSSELNINFHFKTVEPDGLLFFNAGDKNKQDFIAIELVAGQVRYVFNLGNRPEKYISGTAPFVKNQTSDKNPKSRACRLTSPGLGLQDIVFS